MKRYFKNRVLFGGVVLFVLINIANYVIHQVLLGADYASQDKLWRTGPEIADKMWIFQVIFLVQAYFLSFLFSRGYEGTGWVEGLRYGVIMGIFLKIPEAYSQFVVLPISYSLALKTFAYGMIEMVILGCVLGFIYQKK